MTCYPESELATMRDRQHKKARSMFRVHDRRDWLSGYPFEVARLEEILEFYRNKGLVLDGLVSSGGLAKNQFVSTKRGSTES